MGQRRGSCRHPLASLCLAAVGLLVQPSLAFINSKVPRPREFSANFRGPPLHPLASSSASDNFDMVHQHQQQQRQSPQFPLPETLKAVIFDIDGTLADSWKLGYDASQVVLENNQLPLITEQVYHDCTRYATPQRLARHAGLEPTDGDFEQVGKQLAKEFDDLYVVLVTKETAGFFPGMVETLQRILEDTGPNDGHAPKLKLGALTNACVAYAHAVLKVNSLKESYSFYQQFQSIHGADTVPSPKPDPDGLWLVCQELEVAPEDCVYVGDSPSDAVAAHAAGMASIGVTWGSHSKESLRQAPFTSLCSSVEELCTVLKL